MSEKRRFDVYECITDKILTKMEDGIIPWDIPWYGCDKGAYNRITQKSYSFLNQMLLNHKGEYASFKQWSELGGKIKKGAKSEIVCFWKILKMESITDKDKENEQKQNDKAKEVKNVRIKTIPVLKYYNVFHISQVEGVTPLNLPDNEFNDILDAENVIKNYCDSSHVEFVSAMSEQACYNPFSDSVHIPLKMEFKSEELYYSTAFHELIHSTGHPSRLARINTEHFDVFGSEGYSKEELVAEIGSAGLLSYLGIETDSTFKNNVAYLQNWLQALKNDKKMIVSAASKAENAMNLILKATVEVKKLPQYI